MSLAIQTTASARKYDLCCDAFHREYRRQYSAPARVVYYLGERQRSEHLTRRLLGRTLDDVQWAALAGAPDGAGVEVGTYRGGVYLEMRAAAPNCYGGVWLLRRDGSRVVLACDALWIHRRELRGRGLGREILARQLHQARRLRIDRIETIAGRGERENGYYSWPRFGFDGRLPTALCRRLPPAWKHVRRVLDLMRSESGRQWWKTHGVTLPLAFELADGSRCWQAFHRYMRDCRYK